MRELFTITPSTQAGPHRWLRTGAPAAVGLGLLLLALAGCGQASPSASLSPEPVEAGIDTGDTAGPPVDGDPPTVNPPTVDGNPAPVGGAPRVTIEALVQYVTLGGVLRFELSADPAPAAPLTVYLWWSDSERVLSGTPPQTVTIPTSGTASFSVATSSEDYPLGADRTARVLVGIYPTWSYAGGGAAVGVSVRGRQASPVLVSIAADPVSVNEGEPVTFTVTADPPPASSISVKLNWQRGERFTETPPSRVTIPTSGSASFVLPTLNDVIDNYGADLVGVGVDSGSGYHIGSPPWATITVADDELTSALTVVADSEHVVEGNNLSFTLTADPVPVSDLTVNLGWTVTGFSSTVAHTIAATPDTVTIPTNSGTATVTVATTDDSKYVGSTTVEVAVLEGEFYFVPSFPKASITILDND